MWKWIGGAIVVILLFFAFASYWGYRTLTAGGDSVIITMDAPPDRVFASLANFDSLSGWWTGSGERALTARHGPFVLGDTVPLEAVKAAAPGRRRMYWTVAELVPNKLLTLEMRNDSSGRVVATRRDSLAARGDSTVIVSTITSPMMDSLRSPRKDGSGGPGALLDVSAKMLVSSFRMQSSVGLKRLKARVEAQPDRPVRP